MAKIDTYPTGTPASTDQIPYVADPAGTPALKLATVSALSGGSGVTNPWGLFSRSSPIVADEFNGTAPLTWTNVTNGTATWAVGNDVQSVKFGSQGDQVIASRLTAYALAVGQTVETSFVYAGARINGAIGLVIANGTVSTSPVIFGGVFDTGLAPNLLIRGGTLAQTTNEINALFGLDGPARSTRVRWTRVTTNTWRFELSIDGVSWTGLGLSDFTLTRTPTHVGVAVSTWGSGTGYGDLVAAFDYLRVY